MSDEARSMARRFSHSLDIPVYLQDERVTSYEAKSRLWQRGFDMLAFLVRVGGHRLLFLSSANFVEEALVGLQPDVAVLAVGLRERVPDYTCRLMRVLERPRLVLPTHFDGQTTALERVGEEGAELDAGLRPFLREVRGCSRRTRARVPRHFEPIRLPPAPAR